MSSAVACNRCGQPWVPWKGTRLATHARCHFTPEEQDAIVARLAASPRVTQTALAAELGVTVTVLRASIGAAAKRARRLAGG